jgi:hypothetical protein
MAHQSAPLQNQKQIQLCPPEKQADATKSTAMSRPDAGAAKIKGGLPGQPLATLLLERELGRELELARI